MIDCYLIRYINRELKEIRLKGEPNEYDKVRIDTLEALAWQFCLDLTDEDCQ